MDFPKKQAQRLIPLYLLEYNEELFNNHPDPSESWGGSEYTAGYGIDITNDEISIDTEVIATKSDITSMVTTTMLEDALDDYALSTDIPTDVSELNNDAGYATETWVENKGYSTFSGDYNDLTNKPTNLVTTDTSQTITNSKYFGSGKLSVSDTLRGTLFFYPMNFTYSGGIGQRTEFDLPTYKPSGTTQSPTTYTLATTDDIPDTTNFVTTNTAQTISGIKAFTGNVNVASVLEGDPNLSIVNSIALTGFSYNSRDFELPVSKPASSGIPYTIATTDDIITSYNDLTDKPTIPTVNNPTITFTQGGTTKGTITLNQSTNQTIALDAGGGGTLSTTSETLTFTYADNTTGTLTVITSVTLS